MVDILFKFSFRL